MENELKEFDFSRDEIKLDNSIVERAIGNLNKNAFSLFAFLCADFSRENLVETPDLFKLTIRNSDFLNSIGYTSNSSYTDIKKYFKELQKEIFEIPIWDKGELAGEVITGLILKSMVHKKGTTTVWITKELAPYYYTMKVERDRTITRYNLLKQFNSEFSSKIYFMLIRWRAVKGKKITLEIEELKESLGLKGKYLDDFKGFNRRVLTVAKAEINGKSDIIMEYNKLSLGESTGKGRKPITHIEFYFKMKNENQQQDILTENQIIELLELAEKRVIGTDKIAKDFYDYAFSVAVEGCKNNRGFYKYMKSVLNSDNIFLGQVSMFTNPDVRAKAKSNQIHKELFEEKKKKTAELKRKIEEETLAYLEGEQEKEKDVELKIEQAEKTDGVKSIDDILRRVLDENHKTNS